MPKITIEAGNYGWDYYVVSRECDRDYLIQSDWDYAPLASMLGWQACSECEATDGTVDCREGCAQFKTVSEHLTSAADYLDAHIGETFEISLEHYESYFPSKEVKG